jgi:8-hydroxy-5-deazaflavin:NADPH oxidoreductase
MNIAILGTGSVGQALAGKLMSLGNDVTVGTRDVEVSLTRVEPDRMGNMGIGQFMVDNPGVKLVTFNDAINSDTDLIINALGGESILEVLGAIDPNLIDSKVMIDVANPLDFSNGFPPSLTICNTTSLGEQVQTQFPTLKVVKALNTVSNPVMINPTALSGNHNLFICGNDMDAKNIVGGVLISMGWNSSQIIDLGDITNARGTEMFLPLWVRIFGKVQTPMFNIGIVTE